MGVDNNDDSMSGQVGRSEMKANSANVIEPFFGAGWDPVLSAQDGVVDFNGPPYNVAMLDSSHAVRYLSDASRLSSFGSGSFSSVMMSSFTLYNNNENVHSVCCPSDYDACYDCENETKLRSVIINTEEGHEGTNICVVAPDQEAHMTSEDRISGSLSKGKKKRCTPECESIDSPLQFTKIQKNNSYEAVKAQNAKVEKKPKWDQSPSVNTCKAGGKQAKDQSENGGAPKEDYIHVRARRGQATNSHSLAERVRREKISERMRLLQDLVPGCNKITGKAVMLDEIINYVQSLQRQVEFLSMKLAAVNPELNFDIEQILTKDIFNSRGGGVEGQGELQTMQNSVEMLGNVISQFPPMAQFHQASSMWDDGLQSVLQVDYIPYAPLDRLEINGSMKAET